MSPDTYSVLNYREAERVEAAWKDLIAQAEAVGAKLPPEAQDAYYQLVLHPVKACGNLVLMHIAAGRNHVFAAQGRASTNAEAARVHELFVKDQELTDFYNQKLAGGKWNHMMDQTHTGYTEWYPPLVNVSPAVSQVLPAKVSLFAIAVEGRPQSWPGFWLPPEFKPIDSLSRRATYFEIYPVGSEPVTVTYKADQPWIVLREEKAFSAGRDDRRVVVDVDWKKAPAGQASGFITVTDGSEQIRIKVTSIKATAQQEKDAKGAFGGLTGPIAIAASDAHRNIAAGGVRWEAIPDFGRSHAAMTVFPVTAPPAKPETGPRLEYDIYLAKPGTYQVDVVTGLTLDFHADNNLGLAVWLDGGKPDVRYVFTPETRAAETSGGKRFNAIAADNARTMHFTVNADRAGRHVLNLGMIDPAVVVQKIVVHEGELPPSYFGPPERAAIP